MTAAKSCKQDAATKRCEDTTGQQKHARRLAHTKRTSQGGGTKSVRLILVQKPPNTHTHTSKTTKHTHTHQTRRQAVSTGQSSSSDESSASEKTSICFSSDTVLGPDQTIQVPGPMLFRADAHTLLHPANTAATHESIPSCHPHNSTAKTALPCLQWTATHMPTALCIVCKTHMCDTLLSCCSSSASGLLLHSLCQQA